MKIIICGSISVAEEILRIKRRLEKMGHEVEVPEGVKRPEIQARTEASTEERAEIKEKYDLIKGYFEKIKLNDVVLVVNPEKKGIPGYIGGNTFLEMGFAYVLGKKLYCLYPIPQIPYTAEILAMKPIVLSGDLTALTA